MVFKQLEDGFIILQICNCFASEEATCVRKYDCDYCKKLATIAGIKVFATCKEDLNKWSASEKGASELVTVNNNNSNVCFLYWLIFKKWKL